MSDIDLNDRAKKLEEKLKLHRQSEELKLNPKANETASGYAQAFRTTTDFVSGPIVGALMGYTIDKYMNTSPWGLIVMLVLGFVAGVFNLMKSAKNVR